MKNYSSKQTLLIFPVFIICLSRDLLTDNNAVASIVGGIMSHDIVKVRKQALMKVFLLIHCFRLSQNKNQRIISFFSMEYHVLVYQFQ
jgi:hypothetical protein